MAFASLFSRFAGASVLLVGADGAATDLMRRLVGAGARVHWVVQDLDLAEEIGLSSRPDRIMIALREPCPADIEKAAAVIVAAGEPVASRVAAQARALDRPVAVLGRPDLSTFDLDDTDDHGSGDVAAWQPRLRAPLRRASAWLSGHLSRAMAVLVGLPASFGA